MLFVGQRQDFGPCILYCSFITSSKIWESKTLFIYSDSELLESQMFACMYCFWKKLQISTVLEKKIDYLVTKLMIVHSYFSTICLWALDDFPPQVYCAIYWDSFMLEVCFCFETIKREDQWFEYIMLSQLVCCLVPATDSQILSLDFFWFSS